MKALAAALLLLAACDGTSGTIALTLATAPDSQVLASVDKVRITTTNPQTVNEATRKSDGIDLSVEFESSDLPGIVFVECFDASDVLVATGQSAPFMLGGGDANLVIYVAEPYSINAAPVRLATGRMDLAAAPIVFGAVIAGGIDGAGTVSDAISIYNVYSHDLQEGAAMPSRRHGQSLGANINGAVYLFGGTGENNDPTSTLFEFISTTAPAGSYLNAGDQVGFERTNQPALQVAPDTFVVTGSPPINIALAAVTARADMPALAAYGTSASGASNGRSGTAAAMRADLQALVTFDQESFAEHALPGAIASPVAALPDGSFLVVGAGSGQSFHVTGDTVTMMSLLSTPRVDPSVAVTTRYVVVAGGSDASGTPMPIPSADILDATTLELVATVPILPRTHTHAVAMANEQVMLVGGDTASDVIELFTPPVATN